MIAADAVKQITLKLAAISTTPRLDAELLAAKILQRSRAWLFAHGEQVLTASQHQQLQDLAVRRHCGEPMAYILGHKEFWGFTLTVTPEVLVPRPETEHIVEWILANFPEYPPLQLADLGTGSGAIALAIAAERPAWRVDATDISPQALAVARQNAENNAASNVNFFLGDWCVALPAKKYDLLISNPPYIASAEIAKVPVRRAPITMVTVLPR